MKRLVVVLLVTLWSSLCFSQSTSEKLTNAKIISMVKGSLPKAAIIKSIENRQGNFNTSTDALIALKKQGVPDDVITAMVAKGEVVTSAPIPLQKQIAATVSPTVDAVNHLCFYDLKANRATPLEKGTATMKTKYKMLGYGGVSRFYSVEGNKSPVRVMLSDSLRFVIRTTGQLPELILYKLTADKKVRGVATEKLSILSGPSAGASGISYNVTTLKDGIYQFTPAQKLEAGEYWFSTKSSINTSTIDVFAFGLE